MLYYSGFLILVALVTGTLGSVDSSGTTASIMKIGFFTSVLLFTFSLGRRKRVKA